MDNRELRIRCQGMSTEMKWEDLRILLEDSSLPWFKDESSIYVIGYETDVELTLD